MTKSRDPEEPSIERRRFLQHGTLAGAAAIIGSSASDKSQSQEITEETASRPVAPVMTAEDEAAPPAHAQVMSADERSGSDFMVDVFQSLEFDYICANPGSSFRGLHESIINYRFM